jgi:hypothetical protein
MTEIKAGVYDAKVIDYSVGKTKKGDPMVMVRFAIAENQALTWYGTFSSEKSAEITCEALAICGWSTKNPADLSKGKGSGVLDEKRTVSLTIAPDTYDGKTRMKIKYINPAGGGGFRDKMEHKEAVTLFNGLNLAGIAAAAQKKHKKEIVNHAPTLDTEEPIPF